MKDIVIKAADIRRELVILVVCFVLSYGCNIFAVIHYHRPAVELISTIGYVLCLMVLLYAALLLVRIIVRLLLKLFRRR